MSILVVGSIALDSVKTPCGETKEALGGSALYFSAAASFFAKVKVVGVVGEDFPHHKVRFLEERGVNLEGLEIRKGKTFRWVGCYEHNLNEAKTLSTCLNVFKDFNPKLAKGYEKNDFVFLANIDPVLQRKVLTKVEKPKAVVCDTMNFWIKGKRKELIKTLKDVDIMILNDAEVKEFAGEPNLIKAAKWIRSLGPKIVVVKKGEHGALMFYSQDLIFSAPAYPLESVSDPTGAGDSFAGGFVGCLARLKEMTESNLRKAVIYGSVMASFCVEKFSLERLKTLTSEEINQRFREFGRLVHFGR
ncbi:MAG: PfkB family carbohydrate kinase [Candidatus Edwardsbacteria bacterium]